MTILELESRLQKIVAMALPEPSTIPWAYGEDPRYFYHPKEYVEGYVACARDFLETIRREGLTYTSRCVPEEDLPADGGRGDR